MIISILHWHVFIVALGIITNYVDMVPSAWEHCTSTHTKENLPIHPDDPAFSQQFAGSHGDGAMPSTSRSVPALPHATVIHR